MPTADSKQPRFDRKTQVHLWYAMIAVMVILAIQAWWGSVNRIEYLPYSRFQELLKAGQVERIAISENTIQGTLKQPLEDGVARFRTTRVQPDFADELSKYNVVFDGAIENTFLRDLLSWILPVLLFFGVWWFMIRRLAEKQGMGGLMSVGKSRAKIYVERDTQTRFEDVAGVEEAKHELQETVAFLKDPKTYGRLGARQPKGILLVGPPGTGKTLLARAVAGEAGVPFFSISGAEFVEMFVGVGAARVRDLFEQARKQAPCIIFIDELDALGRARSGIRGGFGGHDEKEQTLNQLLTEMDGFDPRQGIVILAATNQPQVLDPALLRAGRFDRQVLVDRPDRKGRLAILRVHAKKIKLADGLDLEAVAAITPGFSGADLENLVNEAAIMATRRDAPAVELRDFNAAIERIVAGLEKRSRVLSETERRTVAYHEMGHAIVAMVLPGVDPVHKISIVPRGIGALGYTMQRPTEDRFLIVKQELENRMAVLLGGRAAEKIVFGRISTGAADDLAKVTEIARSMVAKFGMVPGLGQVAYEEPRPGFLGDAPNPFGPQRDYSEVTAREIDCAVRELTETAYGRAQEILSRNREALDRGAEILLERETIEAEELEALDPLLDRREPAPVGSVGRIATEMPAAPRGDGADERRRAAGQ